MTETLVVCAREGCHKPLRLKRKNQRFCNSGCRYEQFVIEKGMRRGWQEIAGELAEALRRCMTKGTLPRDVEREATAALKLTLRQRGPVTRRVKAKA